MNRFAVVLFLGWVFLAGVEPAWARCDWRAERRQAAARIEEARESVARSGIPEARELLAASRARAREAEERGRRGDDEAACRLARVAQSLAGKAVEVARGGSGKSDELERMLRQTDQVLEAAGARLQGRKSTQARERLEAARKQQQDAWSAFRSRRPRMALKLTLMARENVRRIP